ncbi:MAG: hypothetical protein L0G22_06545 [Propionibacteriaceae bacterium]|nr:hypothetical protein [Propionibacteriaceae bacterium]
MVPPTPVSAQLQRRVRSGGGEPLLTHYGADGARTELSVASFANWVDKTANLLDDLGLDEDADIALPVLEEVPTHWMALVWPFACWRAGVGVRVCPRAEADGAELVVIGPVAPMPVGEVTLACSLDPWGRPLGDLPPGVSDYAGEALAQPDVFAGGGESSAMAWTDAGGVRTHSDVAALAPLAERVCASPGEAWEAVSLLARVVLGGGSLVVVADPTADAARVAGSERARLLP